MNRKFGFTLTEMIIALGVIGIITALVVPGVIQKYQRDAQIMQLKKAYTNLEHNLTMLSSENIKGDLTTSKLGGDITNKTNPGNSFKRSNVETFFKDYYKITKDCGTTPTPCFAESYKSISDPSSNEALDIGGNACYGALLADGSSIYICPQTILIGRGQSGTSTDYIPAKFYIDVNGPDKPNIGGRDMFVFNIYNDYSIDVISPETKINGDAKAEREEFFNDNCLTSSIGEGCLGKIINDNWKMNY